MVDFFMEALNMDGGHDDQVSNQLSIPADKRETALISQLLLLFFAGMDTSSTILAVCMCCLANNPDVQVKIGLMAQPLSYQVTLAIPIFPTGNSIK